MKKALIAWIAILASASALGQDYPSKPITFVIPFAAGGDSDLSGRNLALHAQKYLNNQPIVPMNRVGASGVIGATAVKTAPPDGYTLLVARIATHAIVPALDSKAPYKSAADLIGAIRSAPGKLNFSTAGVGTSQNMAGQYWMTLAGLSKDAVVGIHYKGGGEVTSAVLGGQVDFACNNAPTVVPHVKAGALRALMVMPTRLAELPEVPSAREAGFPDMEKIVGWTALMGPPGLPKEVVDRWTDTFAKLAKDPDWQAGNAKLGGIVAIRSPADTERFVHEQYELYDGLVTRLGIRQ